MREIAQVICVALSGRFESEREALLERTTALMERYPLYPQLGRDAGLGSLKRAGSSARPAPEATGSIRESRRARRPRPGTRLAARAARPRPRPRAAGRRTDPRPRARTAGRRARQGAGLDQGRRRLQRLRGQQGAKARVAAGRRPPARQAHDPHRRRSGDQPRPGDGAVRPAARHANGARPGAAARQRARSTPARANPRHRGGAPFPAGRPAGLRARRLADAQARHPAGEPPLPPAPGGIGAAGLRRVRGGGARARRSGRGRRAARALAHRGRPRQRRHRRRAAGGAEARRACARAWFASWSTTW